jgi:hypothetical protein
MFGRKLVGSLGAGVVALGIAAAAAPAQAATFTVYNTDSWGKGSLRTAMSAAEVTDTRDEILFEIPGEGVHTIALDVALPVISKPLTIDGYSQLGANPATEDSPAEPKIVIDAANVARGLDVAGDDIEIRGLVVKNAQEDGIVVDGARTPLPATTSAPMPPARTRGRTTGTPCRSPLATTSSAAPIPRTAT